MLLWFDTQGHFESLISPISYWSCIPLGGGQVETEETENGNGKLKRKAETEKLKMVVVVRNINGIEHALC